MDGYIGALGCWKLKIPGSERGMEGASCQADIRQRIRNREHFSSISQPVSSTLLPQEEHAT